MIARPALYALVHIAHSALVCSAPLLSQIEPDEKERVEEVEEVEEEEHSQTKHQDGVGT
jgi:hypothetical protein